MSIIFNGITVDKVIYNGTELDKIVYNGTTVFEKASTEYTVTISLTRGLGTYQKHLIYVNGKELSLFTGESYLEITTSEAIKFEWGGYDTFDGDTVFNITAPGLNEFLSSSDTIFLYTPTSNIDITIRVDTVELVEPIEPIEPVLPIE